MVQLKSLFGKKSRLVSQITAVLILLAIFFVMMILRQSSSIKAPTIHQSNATSNSLFYAANKEFSVNLGEKNTNKPVIEYSLPAGNKISFAYTNTQGKQNTPESKGNTVTFKEVAPNIDIQYTTLPTGLKEEIILKKQINSHIFNFSLNTTKAFPQVQTDSLYSSTFFDSRGKYLFHFEKPFAIDSKGNRTDNVSVQIKKNTKNNTYSFTLNVDRDWLESPDRVYPISIDPTIIHDTSSEFASGQMNRSYDTGGTETINTPLATGGTITYKDGYAIHTFTSGTSTFTPDSPMDVEVLVVAGGGQGGAGGANVGGAGGGAGGLIYNSSFSVSGAVTVTVGDGALGTGSGLGLSGGNSVFSTITATGGGYAGGPDATTTGTGGAGGSGGGSAGANKLPGSGTSPQGYTGGYGIGTYGNTACAAGGGGGYTAVGANATSTSAPGAGGAGFTSSISGSSVIYAKGGNGGASSGTNGSSATANTGNGGNGSGGTSGTGGAGGSGIVVVRYYVGFQETARSLESYFQELRSDPFTVGLWHLNETSGNALDSSGNGFTGTPTGTTIVDGFLSKARSFNGTSDYITIPDNNYLDITSNLTLSAWINPTVTGNSAYRTIISKRTSAGATNYQLGFDNAAGANQGVLTFFNGTAYTSGYIPPVGQWTHFAVTISGGTNLVIYINGIATKTYTTTALVANTGSFVIGRSGDQSTEYYSGLVDEVRISNIARTPEEIALNASRRPYSTYTSDVLDLTNVASWTSFKWDTFGLATGDGETATASAQSALVAQWNFNETSGTTAVSGGTCGTSCNGTLTNFASTASQDQAPGTGWTAANHRWGAGALMLDGINDTISTGTESNYDFERTSSFSLEAWIQTSSVAQQEIFSKLDSAAPYSGYEFWINPTTGILGLMINNTWSTNTLHVTTINKVNDGNWHHVVATYEGTSAPTGISIYIDGIDQVLSTTYNTLSATTINNVSLYIGSRNNSSYFFKGQIDSPRVYSRALTPSEILSNYNSSRLELQTRVGATADANDGTWEVWKPFASELAIDNMDSFFDRWNIDNYQNSSSTISKIGAINTGTGNDGDCIMDNGTKTLDSTAGSSVCNSSARSAAYAVNFSDTTLEKAGETSVTTSTTPTGLLAGDEILIINLQGVSTNYDSVGKYETHIISSIDTNTLNFTDYPLQNTYDGTTQKVMIQRVPNFGNVTVCGGNTGSGCTAAATLTTTAWNGTKNGVLYFRSTGTTTVNSGGTITTTGLGFVGGVGEAAAAAINYRSYKGESYCGPSTNGGDYTSGPANCGGGGGGFSWGTYYPAGAGGGGYGINGSNGSNSTSAISYGGTMGSAYGINNLPTLFLGSGGGAGGRSANTGGGAGCVGTAGTGGAGGGIIIINTATLTNNGSISNSGNTGGSYSGIAPCRWGGSGGGAGGTVNLQAASLTLGSSSIISSGGAAGASLGLNVGAGGAGGAGRIAVYYTSSLSGITSPVYSPLKLQSQIKSEGTGAIQMSTGIPQVDAGTVGLWHLDETGGTGAYLKDSTTNANNGTPTGTTVAEGISGKARSFNGNSEYLRITNTNFNKVNGQEITIDAWIKPLRFAGQYQDIIGNRSASTLNWLLYQHTTDGSIQLHGAAQNKSTYVPPSGVWTYIAATVNSSGVYNLYANGVLVQTVSGFTYGGIAGELSIGNYGTAEYFQGSIDEVRISNIARTPEEIAEAYRMGRDHRISETISSTDLSGANKIPFWIASDRLGTFSQLTIGESAFANYEPDTNTVGLWHLNELAGTTAYFKDSSGSGHNGTPTGTTFTEGKIGKGRYFNGSSYISLANAYNFTTASFSLSGWFRTSATGAIRAIVAQDNGASGGGWSLRLLSTNVLQFELVNSSNRAVDDANSPVTSTDGLWHYVVGVRDSSAGKIHLYLDGVLVNTINSSGYTVTSAAGVTSSIGRYGTYNGYYFLGDIDEVLISDSARTADEIRQAYEVGARTHNITIDFKAKLGAGNLITDGTDLGFTVDETVYGATLAAGNLFLGDKIIVKENYDGTEYLAQGTVNAVNSSTGAVTVVSWDTGSTFPAAGYTVNATVFKWQREYFDLTKSLSTHRDAITRLTYRITDGSLGTNIWLDDLRSSTGYLSNPFGSTITSSTDNRYFQYRTILSQNTLSATSSALTSISLDYVSNEVPSTPTISTLYLHDKIKIIDTTPEIRFSTSDPDNDDLIYQFEYDTTSAFTGATTKTSNTDTGFANVTTPADTSPFTSGNTISYTFQSALTNNTTYFYRVRAKDLISDTYSSWSSIRSFTIDTSLTKNQWFETMGDQFAIDTYTGNATSSAVTNDVTVSVSNPPSNVDLMEYSSDSSAQSEYLASEITGTGGTISNVGVYKVHSFTTDGTFTPAFAGNVEALVVAGGGAGGVGSNSGGGGGGGLIYDSSHTVTATGYSITIGNGGQTASANGGNSVFNTLSAIGGGGGGSPGGTGKDGGSGGGGSANGTGYAGGSGTTGQGNAGGAGSGWYAGGGGGAGGVGTSAGSGAGGVGLSYSVSGASVTYSVGGTSSSVSPNGAGTANTGMGGGGSQTSANFQGGSGIVIARYVRNALQSFSESTIKTQGSYSLKGIASASASLNQNLISTPSSAINLSGYSSISFDLRSTRTGSNIKISIHDSGGTTTEITPNITVADTFQTATIDLSAVANANKDAIDQIIITIVNADAANTFYLDNLTASLPVTATGTILSTAITASTIVSTAPSWNNLQFSQSTGANITYQIYYDNAGTPTIIPDSALPGNSTGFSISPISLTSLTTSAYPILYVKASLSDSSGTPYLYDWSVTLNIPPNTPTLDSPTDTAVSQPLLTVFKTTATDPDGDSLKYKINLCTDSAMTANCQTFNQTVSTTGWSAASYASGVQGIYTVQTALIPNTTYYWKSLTIDYAGTNTWSSTQTTPYSFTTNQIPNLPTLDSPVNSAISQSSLTVLKTTGTDDDSDTLKYKINLCTDSAMTANCQTFDQTVSTTGWSAASYASGVQGVYTIQTALNLGTVYYWKSYAIDPAGSNTWSSTQTTPYSFTTNQAPNVVTQDAPANSATEITLTTIFQITTTDVDSDYLRYKIHLCTNVFMTVNCQIFDQTSSQTGWTSQNAESSTAYTSGTQATYTVQTNLVPGTLYYWLAYAIDPAGTNTWSTAQSSPQTFTTKGNPSAPTSCTTVKASDNSSITINWAENATNEDNYQIWSSVNGDLATLVETLSTDTAQYVDSPISSNNTYVYLVRALRFDGANTLYSSWCTTSPSNTSTGSLYFDGLKMEGVKIN